MMQNEGLELLEWIERNGGIFWAADGWYASAFLLRDLEQLAGA